MVSGLRRVVAGHSRFVNEQLNFILFYSIIFHYIHYIILSYMIVYAQFITTTHHKSSCGSGARGIKEHAHLN